MQFGAFSRFALSGTALSLRSYREAELDGKTFFDAPVRNQPDQRSDHKDRLDHTDQMISGNLVY